MQTLNWLTFYKDFRYDQSKEVLFSLRSYYSFVPDVTDYLIIVWKWWESKFQVYQAPITE